MIATEEVDFVQEVLRLTDGKGARVAFDPVGGPNFPKLISALAFQGIFYIYGALSENVTPLPVLEMIAKMATVKGHNISLTSGNPDKLKTAVDFIRRGFDEGKLKPVIDRNLPVRRDRRGSSLFGSQQSVREDRRHPLKAGISTIAILMFGSHQ